jgi:hypothetical protein
MTDIHGGGCACGGVRYQTQGAPRRVSVCSCTWCTKRTGSAFGVSVYFDADKVAFTQGELRPHRLTSDAGRWIETGFCPECGTTVTWRLEFLPGLRGIAGGTFDPPTFWYRPERYVFARSKPDWVAIPAGVEVCQAMPDPKP